MKTTIILLALLALLVCTTFISKATDNIIKDSEEHFDTKLTSSHKVNLLRCMLTLHEIFVKRKLWYNISFGTLLGSVRHRSIIPWDDDIDLIVMKKDLDVIQPAFDELQKEYGYRVEKTWKLIRVYSDETHFIDIFPVSVVDGKVLRCTIADSTRCEGVNGEWWTKDFGFDVKYLGLNVEPKYYQLDGLNLIGPQNSWDLLRFWYGDNFLTTCKTHYLDNHETYVEPKSAKCEGLPVPKF